MEFSNVNSCFASQDWNNFQVKSASTSHYVVPRNPSSKKLNYSQLRGFQCLRPPLKFISFFYSSINWAAKSRLHQLFGQECHWHQDSNAPPDEPPNPPMKRLISVGSVSCDQTPTLLMKSIIELMNQEPPFSDLKLMISPYFFFQN